MKLIKKIMIKLSNYKIVKRKEKIKKILDKASYWLGSNVSFHLHEVPIMNTDGKFYLPIVMTTKDKQFNKIFYLSIDKLYSN